MAKRSSIKATGLGDAITQELTLYHQEVTDRVDRIGEESIKQLAKLTRATAPVGARGDFRKSIASKRLVKRKTGSTYVWYVKAPNHRLTHLLAHGHATKDGGRTRADPFLQNAVDQVLPEYEAAIERTLKNGK
jgi:hypothetical protein